VPSTQREQTQDLDPFEALQVAVEWHREGRVEAAAAVYARLLEIEPGNAEALHCLGVALHHLGRTEEGISAVRRALMLDPGCRPALDDLGRILGESGRLDEAAAVNREAIQLRPHDAKAG
jgi:Flp pilus assembly protein TadD